MFGDYGDYCSYSRVFLSAPMKLPNHNNNRDIKFELVMLQYPELLKELSNSGHFPHRRQLWSELELLMLGYHV